MKEIAEVVLNPIRMRIIQELSTSQTLLTTELCQRLSDIPRTSMYRHIKILIENNIITVVSEKKIRGSFERTLALNVKELQQGNTLERASETALYFLLSKYAQLHTYFTSEQANPGRDKIFLNTTVLMANDTEFDQFLSELQELLLRYSFKDAEGRKARDISIISAPANAS